MFVKKKKRKKNWKQLIILTMLYNFLILKQSHTRNPNIFECLWGRHETNIQKTTSGIDNNDNIACLKVGTISR